ncbi:MAG: N-acetyltransferase [Chloroflexi bacterium]|jgi:GNAT superfamily N-acetyltransferase|nr:N-acetyltransferase [Chloroflexota bacterium]
MAVTIQRVGNDKELKEFIRVPWKVYANDPNWVPWLYYERLEFFDKRKNAFFEHAEGDYFIARRDGEAVGAIAVFVNHRYNDFQQQNVAHFGAFEVMNDREAALALLGTAETWARERGLDSLLGPFTFSTNDETGTLIDGFGSPPVILMTYNQPYVPQFIEAAGFRKAMDLWAWIADLNKLEQEMPEKVRRVVGKVTERYDLHLRLVDLKDWDAEVARIKTIYNSAWERNWGFVPMTDAEIEHMGASLKAVLDPALVFMVEHKGEPVGFSLTLPDANQPLRRIHPGPSRLASYLAAARVYLNRYKTDTVRVLALGVVEKYRGRGVDALMYYETVRAAHRRGYKWAEASWILETNDMMNRALQLMGGTIYKTYRVYEKPLASGQPSTADEGRG